MSRRHTSEWALVLTPRATSEARSKVRHKRASLDTGLIRSGTPESSRDWTGPTFDEATGHTSQNTGATDAELGDTKRLVATLVLQQIRPLHHSAADAKEQSCSSYEAPSGRRGAVTPPPVRSPFPKRSVNPSVTVKAAAQDLSPASMETLFIELARRRLPSLAAKEKPS